MEYQLPVDPEPPSNCKECPFLADCGGLEGEAYDRGCFQRCVQHCQFKWCDMACPCLHLRFAELIEDVGGLCIPPRRSLLPCSLADLPYYIPHIEHGSRREAVLDALLVSVPLTALIRKNSRGGYVARYDTPESMRDGLRLSRGTAVIVSSIAPDQPLEDFWASHISEGTLGQLASLRLLAMTVPNFSFMLDVPRINSLYNLTRIFRMSERISDAGIATILHLQASTRHDWTRWARVLRDQPKSLCVAVEFQTGARRHETGSQYFAGLVGLQDQLGRPLHPFAVAGGCRMREFARHFKTFSVVDSTPFIKTMKRRILSNPTSGGWRSYPTDAGQSLSALLSHNIDAHSERLHFRAGLMSNSLRQQLLLPPAA